eukprot:TRINITY_DN4163_c0_g2_i1.p1 TRINITY_DN4163_c0_g2~~TRINITY_DN4163_c0_g2_i1.p1  ORF type:complete len:195 (-),score=34.47 TRINITY_DN4163_c0_g2_i1:203-715(-)
MNTVSSSPPNITSLSVNTNISKIGPCSNESSSFRKKTEPLSPEEIQKYEQRLRSVLKEASGEQEKKERVLISYLKNIPHTEKGQNKQLRRLRKYVEQAERFQSIAGEERLNFQALQFIETRNNSKKGFCCNECWCPKQFCICKKILPLSHKAGVRFFIFLHHQGILFLLS